MLQSLRCKNTIIFASSQICEDFLIPLHKIPYQLENRFVGIELHGFVGVEYSVVILEGIAFLVFEEDARNIAFCKRIMVAVATV
jgi:hypothetical protein